jgi:amino acid transporter
LLPVAVGVSVDTRWTKWQEGYFPNVAEQIGGSGLGTWLTLAGLASAAGLFNALLCTSSRVSYAMAFRRMLPLPLAKRHPRYATPVMSIVVNSIGVALLIPFSFQELIQVDMFLYALALVLEFAALIRLRLKEPDMARPFRVPFGIPGVIALTMPPVALCIVSMAVANAATKIVCLAAIAVGLVIYRLQGKFSEQRETEPAPAA